MGKAKGQKLYKIDQILKKKVEKNKTFYLIKWKDYGEEYNSWTELKDVTEDAVKDYENSLNKALNTSEQEAGPSAPQAESPEYCGTPVDIVEATNDTPNRQVAFRVKFSDGEIKTIAKDFVTEHWPRVVISFYEKHIKFEPKEIEIPLMGKLSNRKSTSRK